MINKDGPFKGINNQYNKDNSFSEMNNLNFQNNHQRNIEEIIAEEQKLMEKVHSFID
jgi:hypothetical protein